ncbi:MAG: hypothetical protein PVG39_00665 [Desulfobacteraceae bacterium]|jgi:hypothetical protein
MTHITFLKPEENYCFTSKTYHLVDNKPREKDSYRMGEYFSFKSFNISTLKQAYDFIKKYSDGWIRINGKPRPDLDNLIEPVRRNNVNFPETESNLIMLDIDGWALPKGYEWDLHSPDATHDLIVKMLQIKGFDYLTTSDFIFLLTSGQWEADRLNCHLYFYLDKPIHISVLRDWCTALAKVRQQKVFDPMTQRSAQPDYIGKRKCIGFQDPRPEKARICYCHNGNPVLSYDVFLEKLNQDLKSAGYSAGSNNLQAPIRHNWLETLKLCGQPSRGINEPSHRAAAQLVQEVGRGAILSNITRYAEQMHKSAWESIHTNDPYTKGERDYSKDSITYNKLRFQQYLTSACNKNFGSQVDKLKEIVEGAINQASNGDIAMLFERPVFDAYMRLKSSHTGAFAHVRALFKKKLRGVVPITDFEGAARTQNTGTEENNEAHFNGDMEIENQYLNTVLDEFDWLEDDNGQHWCGWHSGNGVGNYRIASLNSNLRNILYQVGLEKSGGSVSGRFGDKALRLLHGHKERYQDTPESRFKKVMVGLRVAPVGGSYSSELTTWVHAGLQPDGKSLCIKIEPGNIEYFTLKDCPVRWRTPEDFAPIIFANTEQVAKKFNSIEDLKTWTIDRLFQFFTVNRSEQPMLLGIILAILSGRGTSPLIEFVGPRASGKSTASRMMVDLLDPKKGGLNSDGSISDLGSIKKEDLINVVQDRYLSAFDNMSGLNPRLQDQLCQIATGISKDQRIMYVGTYTKVFAKRPIILSALAPIVTRSDLASRTETFHFNKQFILPPNTVTHEWERDKPFIFTGLTHLLKDVLLKIDPSRRMSGIEARRMWYEVADDFFYKEKVEREGIRLDRKIQGSLNTLVNSDFCLGIVAWLQQKEKDGNTEVQGVVSSLLDNFKEFILSRQGTTIIIPTPGETIEWRVADWGLRIPNTPRGFTFQLNKFYHTILDICGWDINAGMDRKASGIVRTFCKLNKIEVIDRENKILVDSHGDLI